MLVATYNGRLREYEWETAAQMLAERMGDSWAGPDDDDVLVRVEHFVGQEFLPWILISLAERGEDRLPVFGDLIQVIQKLQREGE